MIISKPFLTAEQIHQRVEQIAVQVSQDYLEKELLAVGILKGSFMFFADLVRAIKLPVAVDFVVSSSYVKMSSSGDVKIHYDLRTDVSGMDILLIDDIIDTGLSLNLVRERLISKAPASLRTCVLLDKRQQRVVDVPLDYCGFEIPNEFVVGYGLDYENRFRNLPYVAIFKKKT